MVFLLNSNVNIDDNFWYIAKGILILLKNGNISIFTIHYSQESSCFFSYPLTLFVLAVNLEIATQINDCYFHSTCCYYVKPVYTNPFSLKDN